MTVAEQIIRYEPIPGGLDLCRLYFRTYTEGPKA